MALSSVVVVLVDLIASLLASCNCPRCTDRSGDKSAVQTIITGPPTSLISFFNPDKFWAKFRIFCLNVIVWREMLQCAFPQYKPRCMLLAPIVAFAGNRDIIVCLRDAEIKCTAFFSLFRRCTSTCPVTQQTAAAAPTNVPTAIFPRSEELLLRISGRRRAPPQSGDGVT